MSGTKAGSIKAVKTIESKYGKGFWATTGALGGAKGKKDGTMKGFAVSGKARSAGRTGGLKSRRGPAKPPVDLSKTVEDLEPKSRRMWPW